MQKLGIVGGTGPESTVDYYQSIISKYQERVGTKEDLPELLINSVNMYRIFEFLEEGQLEELANYLAEAVNSLQRAGADFAVISANTPHIVFQEIQQQAAIPMISIIEETARKAEQLELNKLVLLGTKFTMENDFFKEPFLDKGKEVAVPTEEEQLYIHGKTVEELENGIVNPETKEKFLEIANRLIEQEQADGVILGCTEFPMIIKPGDLAVPQLNTAEIHVDRIVEMMFDESAGKGFESTGK